MDDLRSSWALGGLILALLLLPGLARRAPPPPPPLEPPPWASAAADLGWPLAPGESDPAAWSSLPGIGPARARALADAARAGELQRPDDLLRVPGFGIKMAAVVAERVAWTSEEPSSKACTMSTKAE